MTTRRHDRGFAILVPATVLWVRPAGGQEPMSEFGRTYRGAPPLQEVTLDPATEAVAHGV